MRRLRDGENASIGRNSDARAEVIDLRDRRVLDDQRRIEVSRVARLLEVEEVFGRNRRRGDGAEVEKLNDELVRAPRVAEPEAVSPESQSDRPRRTRVGVLDAFARGVCV